MLVLKVQGLEAFDALGVDFFGGESLVIDMGLLTSFFYMSKFSENHLLKMLSPSTVYFLHINQVSGGGFHYMNPYMFGYSILFH